MNEKWIFFESGALSNNPEIKVCTFLIDLKPTEIDQPLGKFQHTIFSKDDVKKLIITINSQLEKNDGPSLDESTLTTVFEKFWPDLETELKGILSSGTKQEAPKRNEKAMIEEILETVRNIERNQERVKQQKVEQIGILGRSGLDIANLVSPFSYSIPRPPDISLPKMEPLGLRRVKDSKEREGIRRR